MAFANALLGVDVAMLDACDVVDDHLIETTRKTVDNKSAFLDMAVP